MCLFVGPPLAEPRKQTADTEAGEKYRARDGITGQCHTRKLNIGHMPGTLPSLDPEDGNANVYHEIIMS